MFGSLFHLAIDALLFSALLAGIKRATGLTYVPRCQPCISLTASQTRAISSTQQGRPP